jgi:hypothetical protein
MRIPKESYSEKFRKLPLPEKIRVRRALWNEAAKLGLEAKKFAEEMEAFNHKTVDLVRGRQRNVDVEKLKEELRGLHDREFEIREELAKFVKKATPFFRDFKPHYSAIYANENPLELKTHKIFQMLTGNEWAQNDAFRNIETIKEKRR